MRQCRTCQREEMHSCVPNANANMSSSNLNPSSGSYGIPVEEILARAGLHEGDVEFVSFADSADENCDSDQDSNVASNMFVSSCQRFIRGFTLVSLRLVPRMVDLSPNSDDDPISSLTFDVSDGARGVVGVDGS